MMYRSDFLHAKRVVTGKSIDDIVDETGLGLSTVKAIFGGTAQNPGVVNLEKCAKAVALTLTDIFSEGKIDVVLVAE